MLAYKRMNTYYEYLASSVRNALFRRRQVVFISEMADWVIREVGSEIVRELNRTVYARYAMQSTSQLFLRHTIVHFSSIGTLFRRPEVFPTLSTTNRHVLTWYHIVEHDPFLKHIDAINKRIDRVHTACQRTADQLRAAGIMPEKIVLIPLAIDLNIFTQYAPEERTALKQRLGLPLDKIIIGSFQKDGNGWGEGSTPKLIKGPDIFCDSLERMAKQFPLHVLLTGPARGYVKQRLTQAGIPFTHHYITQYQHIPDYYNALDLYIVASRIEGGPRALLESMACGVPLVTTDVGMAPDIVRDGYNAHMVPVEDVEGIVRAASHILTNYSVKELLVNGGFETVRSFNIPSMTRRYVSELYAPLSHT